MEVKEIIGAAIGLALYFFAAPALGWFIAVKIFKCPEWDKADRGDSDE